MTDRTPSPPASPEPARRAARRSRTSLLLGAALVSPFALPVVVLVARAFLDGSLAHSAATRVVLDALTLSLLTTAAAMVVAVAIGLPLAFILARRDFRGAPIVEAFVDLPIVLPPSVAGLALLFVFGRLGLVGAPLASVGVSVSFTTLAVVIAQSFVAAPLFVRAARSGLAGVSREVEDAARIDGASDRRVFRSVTVPLAASSLAAGLTMAWARALGEFGATIMFAGSLPGRTQTLPLVVYGEFEAGDVGAATAAAAVLVLAAFAVLVAVHGLHRSAALDLRSMA